MRFLRLGLVFERDRARSVRDSLHLVVRRRIVAAIDRSLAEQIELLEARGLLETVASVSGVISSLSTSTDVSSLFNELQSGLRAPLAGMGTAFGTSLFGLAGSLVLGFLDLQASQAQNRFYNDLEEWLSSLTRLSGGGPVGDGEQAVPALRKVLASSPALETRKRIEELVEKLTSGTLTVEQLRLIRAVETLERIGTPEARQVLRTLAQGAPGALPTREAEAALNRLADPPTPRP